MMAKEQEGHLWELHKVPIAAVAIFSGGVFALMTCQEWMTRSDHVRVNIDDC